MLLISASNLAVDYGGRTIFSDVSLDISSDDRIGLVGENGAGKSTLMRALAGQERPDEGTVVYAKGTRLGYLVQEPHFAPGETVYDAVAGAHQEIATLGARLTTIEAAMSAAGALASSVEAILEEYGAAQHRYEELGGYEYEARVRQVLEGLGLGDAMLPQPAERLSGGQKKLIGLARLLVTSPDVLLLDEPDNHLDFEGKTFLEGYIREYPGAVVVISHDRYLLDRVARRILEVEDGTVTSWTGGYTDYVDQKEAHLQRQRELFQVQQDELRRQEEAMYRLVQWARQNPKFAGRAENMKRQVARKRDEMMDRPQLVRRRIKLDFGQHEGSRKVVTAEHLTLRVPAAGSQTGRELLTDASFAITFGERVGIVGPNGSGKSTLLRAIAGLIEPSAGSLRPGTTVRPGYYAQEQETLPADQTPLEWIRHQKALTEQAGINRLRRLLLTYEDMHAPIGRLSGGQRSRLQFERLMLGDYNLLLLDEPTNNVDIASAEVLESALQTFEGTAVLVSHDRYLLEHAVDRIVELPGDGTLREYPGNYAYYLEHRRQVTAAPTSTRLHPPPAPPMHSEPPPGVTPPRAPDRAPGRAENLDRHDNNSRLTDHERPQRLAVRRVRVALLGLPGAGKRALLAELASRPLAPGDHDRGPTVVALSHALVAELSITTLAGDDTGPLIEAARGAEALLLAQDLADNSLVQISRLRTTLAASHIFPVPQPLPITVRLRNKGGLNIAGCEGTGEREEMARWCRTRNITHADLTMRCAVDRRDLLLCLEAAWQRVGGARPRQGAEAAITSAFRPTLIIGTRYDELDGGMAGVAVAEQRLRVAAPCFGSVATSVLDPESITRLREALTALAAG